MNCRDRGGTLVAPDAWKQGELIDGHGVVSRASLLALAGLLMMVVSTGAFAASETHAINPGVPWPATDALGRTLPTPAEVGPPRPDRVVGIFYFLWHDQKALPNHPGPYDISKILLADPDALKKPDSPLWGPIGMFHYWGEPLYGYYRSDDPWVIRRHAALLSDAGIDTLIFDTTNAVTYPEAYHKLCDVFEEVRREGGRTPQIVFMVHTEAGKTAQRIYDDLYKPGLYKDLWFQWDGKPLMICDPMEASPEVRAFFTLRAAHWPFQLVNTPYAWHWEATYPQPYGYTDDPAKPEEVNVSVAQNLRVSDGAVTNMSSGDARGRAFHDGKMDLSPGAVAQGYNFQEQWKRALELNPPFVMVTGWNEWIAGRWGSPTGPLTFVDQMDADYSRDIEPMTGGFGDDYYYQLVANVRRYKGCPPIPQGSRPKTIRIDGPFDQWKSVGPEFTGDVGATRPRDSDGVSGTHYTNHTGRNNLVSMKVVRDSRNLYFYLRTEDPVTPPGTAAGAWLLIDSDQNPRTGWEGYDFIVNRTTDGGAWIEKNSGGWNWEKVAKADLRVEGRELQLAVPRSALNLPRGNRVNFDFKWVDNLQHPGDILDFYVSGDVAPPGRFNFRYSAG